MEVTELYDLTTWVADEIVDHSDHGNLQNDYTALFNILEANVSSGEKQPFEQAKENLLEHLEAIEFSTLTNSQVDFLEKSDLMPVIGKAAPTKIKNILRDVLDIATAAQKIQQMRDQLTKGLERIGMLSEGLKDCVPPSEDYNELLPGGILTRVSFHGDVGIGNMADFMERAETWHRIGHGLARAHDTPVEDIRIVGASRGSILIDFVLSSEIAYTIILITGSILLVLEKIGNIRLTAARIRNLNLKNRKIAADLEKEIDEEKKEGKAKIKEEQAERLGISGEKGNALDIAIDELINFIDNDGEIDVYLPPPPEEEEDEEGNTIPVKDVHAELRDTAQKKRVTEREVLRLKHASDVPEQDDDNEQEEDESEESEAEEGED